MPNNASPSYEQIFYLGGTGVSGIRNLSAGYSVGQKQIKALGAGFTQEVISEPLRGDMSMTRDMLYQDPVLGLTGEAPISGTLLYGVELDGAEKVYGFNTGYLTSYSINCNVQDVPTIESTFAVFGQLGSGVREGELDYSGVAPLQNLGVVNHESVFLTFNGSGTNRAVSASQTYNINRVPIYTLDQKTSEIYYAPSEVLTEYPIDITTNLTIEMDDYETANMIDNIRSGNYQTLGVEIRLGAKAETLDGHAVVGDKLCLQDNNGDCLGDDGDGITRYEFLSTTGHLVSESIESSVDGVLSVNLEFKDYYNKD
ncbi:MAG: hypothetical protein CL833_06070 [Crocinitomicaceae bacterium]|nr:hypothetical protein [Crocinitomicaceae bacterium]